MISSKTRTLLGIEIGTDFHKNRANFWFIALYLPRDKSRGNRYFMPLASLFGFINIRPPRDTYRGYIIYVRKFECFDTR